MTFTIEPMINLYGPDVDHLDDGWTVITKDGGLSTQRAHNRGYRRWVRCAYCQR